MRSTGLAYLIWFFTGALGGHRFYLGQPHIGLLYFFTGGFCWLGVIYDAFAIPALVDQANAGIYTDAQRSQEAFFARVKHDLRPQAPPQHMPRSRPPNPLVVILGVIMALCFMCLTCIGCVVALGMGTAVREAMEMPSEEELAARERAQAEQELQRQAEESGQLRRVSNPDLDRLLAGHAKLKRALNNKLLPSIRRFEQDRDEAKRQLKRLRPQVAAGDSKAKREAQAYLKEYKEIKVLLARLQAKRDRLERDSIELESSARRLERRLQTADVLNEDQQKELAQLVARGEALAEEAEKGVDKNSLEAQLETPAPEGSAFDSEDMRAINEALSEGE